MVRLFVVPEELALSTIDVRGKEAHYLANVLRLGPGERLAVFDGAGTEADAVIARVEKDRVVLDVVARRTVQDENPLALTVVQAALTGEKAAWLVEKLVEVGVARLVFFRAERSVRTRVLLPRLKRIAQAAARQSGRAVLPAIDEAGDLAAAIASIEDASSMALRLFGQPDVARAVSSFTDVVQRAENAGCDLRTRVRAAVAVGPESGFTEGEERLLCAHGFEGVCLGPRTLRAESAGIVFASILMHRLGDLR